MPRRHNRSHQKTRGGKPNNFTDSGPLHLHKCHCCATLEECRGPMCWDDDWYDGSLHEGLEVHTNMDTYCAKCRNPDQHVVLIMSNGMVGTVGGLLPRGPGGEEKDAKFTLGSFTGWDDYPFEECVPILIDGKPCAVHIATVEGDSAEQMAFSCLRITEEALVWTPRDSVTDPIMGTMRINAYNSWLGFWLFPSWCSTEDT